MSSLHYLVRGIYGGIVLLLAACSSSSDNAAPTSAISSAPPVTSAAASSASSSSAAAAPLAVMAYYYGNGSDLHEYDFNKLTHIIFSFAHMEGNRLVLASEETRQAFQQVASLKQSYPHLKVMLAFGGWGGCETCSEVFAVADNRQAFAESSRDLLEAFNADGLDLDWEYPAIPGYPDHTWSPADKSNFTALVAALRQTLGDDYLLTFAAGGIDQFIDNSVEWSAVMPLVDYVNIMSYDLFEQQLTGFHTALFSTPRQHHSTDRAVQRLLQLGVPAEKIVIGAAFYARAWQQVGEVDNGVRQPGVAAEGLAFRQIPGEWSEANGYLQFWDEVAKAPYVYHPEKQFFASFDNPRSVTEKTRYVKQLGLGGIMFWQLGNDNPDISLLEAIDAAVRARPAPPANF